MRQTTTYIGPAIALGFYLLIALSARQKRRVVQRDCLRVELLLSGLEIGDGRCEIIIWQIHCTSSSPKERKSQSLPCAMCGVHDVSILQAEANDKLFTTNLAVLRSSVACIP